MQFIKDNDFYKVARITGPSHNLLAIRLSDKDCDTIVKPMPISQGDSVKLSDEDVLKQVAAGLKEVNEEIGVSYFISEVQFVPSDTKSDSVYSSLTKELIRRIHNNGDFVVV